MTDQELKELVASLAIKSDRLDAQLSKTSEEIRASQAKTDEQLAKTDAQLAKTDAKLAKVAKLLGSIGNSQGDATEEFFYNSLKKKKELAGIHYDYIDKNLKNRKGKLKDEFDIVMVNGKDVAIIEVKYKVHKSDIEKLATKKKENFNTLFPDYKEFNQHFAIASFSISDELKEEALANHLMVLQRKGDVMETFISTKNS